jgi:hypothetical protein
MTTISAYHLYQWTSPINILLSRRCPLSLHNTGDSAWRGLALGFLPGCRVHEHVFPLCSLQSMVRWLALGTSHFRSRLTLLPAAEQSQQARVH